VGDSGVGKTSILTRFTYEKFNDYSEPTLGAAFLTKKHTLPTGKSIEFHVDSFGFRFGTLQDSKNIAR
jgi:GTPase SAR1 family protein